MRRILLIFSLIINASWELAQASSGQVGITLRVPEIRFISLGNSDRFVHVLPEPTIGETVSLQVLAGPTQNTNPSPVSRSNTAYQPPVQVATSADIPHSQTPRR